MSEAVRRQLDPGDWKVEVPVAGTHDPVRIDFGRSLDRALAERLVVVMFGGEIVTGTVSLGSGERMEPEAGASLARPGARDTSLSPSGGIRPATGRPGF